MQYSTVGAGTHDGKQKGEWFVGCRAQSYDSSLAMLRQRVTLSTAALLQLCRTRWALRYVPWIAGGTRSVVFMRDEQGLV